MARAGWTELNIWSKQPATGRAVSVTAGRCGRGGEMTGLGHRRFPFCILPTGTAAFALPLLFPVPLFAWLFSTLLLPPHCCAEQPTRS